MSKYTIFAAISLLVIGCGTPDEGLFVQEDFEVYSANQFPGHSSWNLVKTGTGVANQQVISQGAKAGIHCMQLVSDLNKDAIMQRDLGEIHDDLTVEGWMQAAPTSTGGIELSGKDATLFVGFDPNGEIMLRANDKVLARVDLGSHKAYWTYVKVKVRMQEGSMSVTLSVGNRVVKKDIEVSPMTLRTLSLKASGTSLVVFDDVVAWTS